MINKDGPKSSCHLRYKFEEIFNHILSGCSVVAEKEYINRRESIGQYIH